MGPTVSPVVLLFTARQYKDIQQNTHQIQPMGEARGYVHHKPPSAAAVWDEQYMNCFEHWGEVW